MKMSFSVKQSNFFFNFWDALNGLPEEHSNECRSGPRSVGSSATGTECLIGRRVADENLDVIVKVFKPEKFLKLLFQFVRPFSCYISDHVGPTSGQQRADIGFTSGRRGEVFQVTISLTHRQLSGR